MARKILLADDSVTAQNMGRKILADAGYEVSTVNNGSAALKRVSEALPDMLVLDVYMPGYGGLEICQHLKESSETAHIPVLLTVGKLEPFKPDEARRVRADAYIVKPFEASELLSAVAHLEDVAAASDRLKVTAKANGKSASKSAVASEPESSWKSRLSVPAPPKIKVPSGSAFHEFRRTRGSKPPAPRNQPQEETPVVPELPRDITPDELDVLSAVAARLDMAVPSQTEAPTTEAPVAAEAQTTATVNPPDPPTPVQELTQAQELTQVTAARFLENPAPIDGADEPLFDAAPSAQQEETAHKSTLELTEGMAASDAVAAAEEPPAAAAGIAADAAAGEINTVDVPQPAEPQLAPQPELAPQELAVAKSEAPAETLEPFEVTAITDAPGGEHTASIELEANAPELAAANTIDAQETLAQAEPESASPSEEEIAEALRLLTPAGASSAGTSSERSAPAQASGQENGHESKTINASAAQTGYAAVSSPRWIAEPVALTPEEAALSLEAEMFGAAVVDVVREKPFAVAGDDASGSEPDMQAGPTAGAFEGAAQAPEEVLPAAHEPVSELVAATEPTAHPVEENVSPAAEADEPILEPMPTATYADFPALEQDESTMLAAAGESTLAEQAVELALAAQAAAGYDANHQEAPKAMAAAATADGGAVTAPDQAAIASIVESVLADLRPRIMEEITKKLMRR